MTLKEFLIIQSDNRCWVITYNSESKERKLLGLKEWIENPENSSIVDAPEKWLEANGSSVEAVFSIDSDKRTVKLSDTERLEYTELLDDLEVY